MFNLPASPYAETTNLERLIEHYPGPAFVVSQNGSILAYNEKALFMLSEDKETLREQVSQSIHPHILHLLETGESQSWHMKCENDPDESSAQSFMMSGVPFPAGKKNCALVLCMETSAETAIRDALIESRSFYKDFSDFSCEFAWTTDENGRFSYVSEKGILGLNSQTLYGMNPSSLLAPGQDPKICELVFKARSSLSNMDIFLRHDGVTKCYRFCVEPVFDATGTWQGTRGIASDITLLKAREAELAEIKEAETRTRKVVDAIRGEIRPDAMLETAASSIVRFGLVDSCWIFHRKVDTDLTAEKSPVICAMTRRQKEKTNTITTNDMRKIISPFLKDSADMIKVFRKDNLQIQIISAAYGGEVYGVLCLVRISEEDEKWSEADMSFARTVADQTAFSLALLEQHSRLHHLSRTDSLTGLLNRRAFKDEANRILAHHKRMKRQAVMLYIDLDNFKKINDTRGHKVGDQVLTSISDLIRSKCRATDIAVRFGGDEFGIFMQEADETIALIKANDLLDGAFEISKKFGAKLKEIDKAKEGLAAICEPDLESFGLSIGIAVYNPYKPESLESLVQRADEALYDVKKSGKGGYRLACGLKEPKEKMADQQDRKAQG